MSSIIPKSAKTTERRAKIVKIEGHSTRPERKPAHAKLNKTRKTASKAGRPKVDASANTLSDDSTKPGAAGSEREQESSLPSSFKIIAGSYERLLYGLQATVSASSPDTSSELEWTLKPIFIFPAHVSYIKAVAASPQGGKWLATGSGDEIIKVWDLRRRKEVGGLMQHEGSTTHFSISLREPTFFLFRLHHPSHILVTLASRLSVRRWDTMYLSRPRLGGASVAEGPQRTR